MYFSNYKIEGEKGRWRGGGGEGMGTGNFPLE